MQNNHIYDLALLWETINNGLTFFEEEFIGFLGTKKGLKGFAVRPDDKTGSCYISKSKKSGLYLFTDFGEFDKGINALDYVIKRDNTDVKGACKTLFNQFNIQVGEYQKIKPDTKFSAKITKDIGFWDIKYFDAIQNEDFLKKIIPFYTDDLLKEYDFKQVISYENVGEKNDKKYHLTTTATNDFPIYAYDKISFAKIYQPVAPKGDDYVLKHGFIGTKEPNIIYGWDNLLKKVNISLIDSYLYELKIAKKPSDIEYFTEQINDQKLDSVIIATGGSDGLNIASLGYNVIWFNSETEIINSKDYATLRKIAKNIYYVPDLDHTGIKQAVAMGMQHINIKILWLPNWLQKQGKKDFSDWIRVKKLEKLESVQYLFKQMLGQALDFQFWDYNDRKKPVLNPKKLLHFLKYKNIYLYKTPFSTSDTGKEDDGYFINIENNIIKQVFSSDIKRIVLDWIDEKYLHIDIYNMVTRSPFFNQNSLKSLPLFDYKKNHSGVDFQYYFFDNVPVKITAEKIETQSFAKGLTVNIWQNDKIDHFFKQETSFFETYKDDLNRLRIKNINNASNYFKVLINTSRVYWKKDADETEIDTNNFNINSKKLTDEENYMQELHLMNKMYCVGHMLHNYKSPSKAYMLIGVDFVSGTSNKGSYGGTGKSFLQKSLTRMLSFKSIGGKTLKDDNFPMDGVNPKTNYVLFDDLMMYQPMEFFYNMVTDDFVANQKGGVKYNIPFDDSPKIGVTTNFAPEMLGSTKRRSIVYYNSDFYHEATSDNNYLFSRKISDDFDGKDILNKEYSPADWNTDFNFQLQCLKFYLGQNDRIIAPLDVLITKNIFMKIGDPYVKFFKEFFTDATGLNVWVEKSITVAIAKEELASKFVSAQKFMENLTLYCQAMKDNGWSLEVKKNRNASNNPVPHYYIDTTGKKPVATENENPKGLFNQEEIIIDDLDF